MPKMTHPNAARPLSVQPEEVDRYAALGWTLANDQPAAEKPTTKKATTRKPAKKK